MILSLLIAAGMACGGILLGFLGWGLRVLWNQRLRRNLASALVGEVAGILEIIETSKLENFLRETAEQQPRKAKRLKPPICIFQQPMILESYAHKLNLFPPRLSRKIAQFHMLLGAVSGNALADTLDTEKANAALGELEEVLLLADDILHSLQPLL